jgi:glycosyltransferase involved in cell wall biosynthesis
MNEENTIAEVIEEIPSAIEGIDRIEIVIVDGASHDNTVERALKAGADQAYIDHRNRGLASAFSKGIHLALLRGADIIVNTDADMQYDQTQIPDLLRPILDGDADMVVGSRFEGEIEDMPLGKTLGNRLATFVTRKLAGQNLTDAQSGFRAIHRELAEKLIVESKKTYVQETLIRASRMGYKIVEVPIRFRKREGDSRLISSIWRYAFEVFPDLVITYAQVAPLRLFGIIAFLSIGICIPAFAVSFLYVVKGNLLGGLSFLTPFLIVLVPTLAILFGSGLVMDHINKTRVWMLENRAFREGRNETNG